MEPSDVTSDIIAIFQSSDDGAIPAPLSGSPVAANVPWKKYFIVFAWKINLSFFSNEKLI